MTIEHILNQCGDGTLTHAQVNALICLAGNGGVPWEEAGRGLRERLSDEVRLRAALLARDAIERGDVKMHRWSEANLQFSIKVLTERLERQELLEALESAHDVLAELAEQAPNLEITLSDSHFRAIKQARLAIAKARGEA